MLAAAAAVVAIAVGAGGLAAVIRNQLADGGGGGSTNTLSTAPTGSVQPSGTKTQTATSAVPADEQCTAQIKANTRWVCLTGATFDGLTLTIEYQADFAGAEPNVRGGYHLHIYGGDGTNPPDRIEGVHAANPGKWYVEDQNPSVRKASSTDYTQAIGDAPKVCARIANSRHELVPDTDGTYKTGNCVPIRRT